MTGAHFEISIDGKPRTYRDTKAMADEAAAVLRRVHPNSDVVVKDLREDLIATSAGTRLMVASAVILGLAMTAHPVQAQVYSGPVVTIQDGDTFTMRDTAGDFRVRLCGVDSPERGHQGYQQAKDALTALIGGKTVRCVQVGSGTPCDNRSPPKSRDRIVAQCFLESKDISDKMVCSGNAVDWEKFSGGYYRPPIPDERCK
jgi:endonuclease YncB( thermonuclease family)